MPMYCWNKKVFCADKSSTLAARITTRLKLAEQAQESKGNMTTHNTTSFHIMTQLYDTERPKEKGVKKAEGGMDKNSHSIFNQSLLLLGLGKTHCPVNVCIFMRERKGRPWVCCNSCDQWYHCKCAGLTKKKQEVDVPKLQNITVYKPLEFQIISYKKL